MLFLDWTFDTAQENLALEEALLEDCNEGGPEVLRIWSPKQKSVVVGYTQQIEREVYTSACREDAVPIVRRISGGGTVLHDFGSLCYCLILRANRPEIASVGAANSWIMARQMESVKRELAESHAAQISVQGDTDLSLDGKKFSGNAQRRKIHAILFHGTFLLNLSPDYMRYLKFPSRQPEYRASRDHSDFLTELHISSSVLTSSLRKTWEAHKEYRRDDIPVARVEELVQQKYARDEWNLRV